MHNLLPETKLDHIAYAVRSTDSAMKMFSIIYPKTTLYKAVEKNQNVLITYLSNETESHRIELVEPIGEENPVKNMLKTKETVMYHLGYRVADFNKSINILKNNNFLMVTTPFETTIEPGIWACHLFNPKCGIIEIIGEKNE